MRPLGLTAFLVAIWFGLALAIDRLLLSAWCFQCANVLALEVIVKLPAATFNYPPVSLLVLLLIPMSALALYAIPWRNLLSSQAWKAAFSYWATPWIWLLVAMVLCVVGESLYLITKDYLPSAINMVADKFTVTASLSVDVKGFKETKPFEITASLSGLIGLTIGAYLFLKKGVNEVFKFKEA